MTNHSRYRLAGMALSLGLSGLAVTLAAPGAAARGTAAAHQQGGTAATTTITAHVAVGQEVLVAVKTNPSTGYHWDVRSVAGIRVSHTDFATRKVDPKHPLVGVPVIRVYHLTVVKARSTPYVVRLVELSPAGQPSGASVLVTIATQP